MTEDAKKAAKSEKKLKVLLGGYQVWIFYYKIKLDYKINNVAVVINLSDKGTQNNIGFR